MNFSKEEIKNLVQTDVSKMSNQGNQNLKTLIETRNDAVEAVDQLNSKNGNLTDQEIRWNNSLSSKIRQMDSKIEAGKAEEQRQAGNSVPYGNSEPGRYNSSLTGGKPLNKEGTIRLYNPQDKIHKPDFNNEEINLGQFLRAAFDKPRTDAEKRMIQNSVTSSGYELPSSVSEEVIDLLRARNPLLMEGGANARVITLSGGETKWITTDSDGSAVWHSELTEESESSPTFSSVDVNPSTLLSVVDVANEVLQDSVNIETALVDSMVGTINDSLLTATFAGATSNGPTGLASTVTQTEEYANGGSPDWSNFVNASKTLYDNNVPEGNRSFVHSPDIWSTLSLITDDNSRYQDSPSFIRNIPNLTSSGVPTGTSYVGDFSNVAYCFRLNIELRQYPAALAKSYGTTFVAAMRVDIATFRPSALVRIEEASA